MKYDKVFDEKFIDRNIAELSKDYILQFSLNVNTSRMSPQIIDGLKPVGRRLLYTMFTKDQGKKLRKVASISGEVIGRFHPHGPSSVVTCIVNFAQKWNNNIPLITGEGNFGSIAGIKAGADRYIQAKLSDFAYDCYFSEWAASNVDMELAFTEEEMEPLYLPAKYPVILVNGILGIGTGMASNIPPYNFKEVCEATIKLIKNPNDKIELIPDSPTGCDICGGNFKKIVEVGHGIYSMRSKYEIDPVKNTIKITNIPYLIASNDIRERIAEIKEAKGLPEIIDLEDATKQDVNLTIYLRNDVNPYKFVKKLFNEVKGLESSYAVNILISDDFRTYELSIRELLNEWIKYRREQKRVMINHQRTSLLAEQRTNDVKIFVMDKNRLEETISLFRTSRTRQETELKLIEKYHDTEIEMDSLQAKTLSDMRLHELNIETYEKCLKRREELKEELNAIDQILSSDDGIDMIIIGELKEGIKKFGTPRKSKLVPWDIEAYQDVKESCILQLSSNGMIQKTISEDLNEEPIPLDTNGFAVRVDSESSFLAIDNKGYYSLIKAKEIPLDSEVPLARYIDNQLSNIIALVSYDSDEKYVTLISRKGILKKIRIRDMKKSKKPCMYLEDDDYIVKGVMTLLNTSYDILVYTSNGYGHRINASDIRITSPAAKGSEGVKLTDDDYVEGIYRINKNDEFLVYVTSKGRFRLNKSQYLPTRKSKHDEMIRLIKLVERDKLVAVVGTSLIDKLEVFFDDQTSEIIPISDMKISTMSEEAVKLTKKSAVSNNITKVKKV